MNCYFKICLNSCKEIIHCCIAISLAKEFKNASIIAIDISQKALEVAEKNLKIHDCNNQIKLKMTDFEPLLNLI